ncbi:MAG: c-type cytochrome [Gammaproteobacteria bacterium]|nr:c-type cytochrome [Gammaproteobacteria bacterium]
MKAGVFRALLVTFITCLLLSCSEKQSVDTVAVAKAEVPIDGAELYKQYCIACHAEGPGHPGTMRLGIRLGEDKAVLTKRTDLQAVYVKTIVRQGILLMPPFRPSEISDAELEALAEYLSTITKT